MCLYCHWQSTILLNLELLIKPTFFRRNTTGCHLVSSILISSVTSLSIVSLLEVLDSFFVDWYRGNQGHFLPTELLMMRMGEKNEKRDKISCRD